MSAAVHKPSGGLVRSMLVTGSAQAASIIISMVRTKGLALLLGPAGVGILSILGSLKDMGTQLAGLGMAQSGVRDIALSRGDDATLSRVRRVLLVAHLVQGAAAMLAIWLLREPLAIWLLADAGRATEIGLVGVTILLALIAAVQGTLLQGLRRIGDLAKAGIISAILATVTGLAAVWLLGSAGLIWFLLVQSLASVVVTAYFTSKVPKPLASPLTLSQVWQVWKPMARLGLGFMLGGLATAATLLLLRAQILQELGLEASGHFAAAWSITMIYVGFLLSAMGADYYPRLAEVIHDKHATGALINDQMQLGLAIGGPVLLLLIGWAPWAVPALYSDEFAPAVALVQWQSLGNIFKIASWPMGFTNVAAGRSKLFLFFQINFNVIFLAFAWLTLGTLGIIATGPAFVLGYIVGFVLGTLVVRKYHDFKRQQLSTYLLIIHGALGIGLLALAHWWPIAAGVAAPMLALLTGLFGLRVVVSKVGQEGRLAKRIRQVYAAIGWPISSTGK